MTPEEVSAQNTKTFAALVDTLIDFEKPLAALVNGPAIGIGVTILPHADFVWSSDDATFRTPFTQIGLVPEACSSYLLPQILGSSNANEILLFGTTFTAQELQVTVNLFFFKYLSTLKETWTCFSNIRERRVLKRKHGSSRLSLRSSSAVNGTWEEPDQERKSSRNSASSKHCNKPQ